MNALSPLAPNPVPEPTLYPRVAEALREISRVAARLAAALPRARTGRPPQEDFAVVAGTSMGLVVQLSRRLAEEAQRVHEALWWSGDELGLALTLEIVTSLGGVATAQDLMLRSRLYATAEIADAALSELERSGWGSWIVRPGASTEDLARALLLHRRPAVTSAATSPGKPS